MSEQLAERYGSALEQTLGHAARMIAFSKSGYCDRHPDHVPVFNANVCLTAGKVWRGDLDLTLDEPKLAELARLLGEIVHVLYESDRSFENESNPLIERAVYSVTPSGHTRFDHRDLERAPDGTLRHRPPAPDTRRRFMLTFGRPRLLRFRQLELVRRRGRERWGADRHWLLYVGARDSGATPLLVLRFSCSARQEVGFAFEWTWYPTCKRHAPRPLLQLRLARPRWKRLQPHIRIAIHPGLEYTLVFGLTLSRRSL